MDAEGLKTLWVTVVRELLQSPGYKVSKSWYKIFIKVADELSAHPEVDPRKFVEAQVKHMLAENLLDKLFPNVLSGDGAMARYLSAPTPLDVEAEILVSLRSQAECFNSVCRAMGENFAFSGIGVDYTPLFFSFMLWSAKRPVGPELRADARAELIHKTAAEKFFPAEFTRSLQV